MPTVPVVPETTGAVPFAVTPSAVTEATLIAAYAEWDGSNASGPFLPCVTIYAQDGTRMARAFPSTVIAVGNKSPVSYFASASGAVAPTFSAAGTLVYKLISAGSTNGTSVKASAGVVSGWFLSNQNPATRYVKLYNKAITPTVGTDVPVMTLALPGGASANVGLPSAVAFATGIGLGTTTGYADNDTGAVLAGDIIINLVYQ